MMRNAIGIDAVVDEQSRRLTHFLIVPRDINEWEDDFDPETAWCPESADDLPGGELWVQQALENLMSVKFYVGKSNGGDAFTGASVFVCRKDNASDMKSIQQQVSDIRELDIMEATKYVCEYYFDAYDWALPERWEELKERRDKSS